jgi:hypothetical protein
LTTVVAGDQVRSVMPREYGEPVGAAEGPR